MKGKLLDSGLLYSNSVPEKSLLFKTHINHMKLPTEKQPTHKLYGNFF